MSLFESQPSSSYLNVEQVTELLRVYELYEQEFGYVDFKDMRKVLGCINLSIIQFNIHQLEYCLNYFQENNGFLTFPQLVDLMSNRLMETHAETSL